MKLRRHFVIYGLVVALIAAFLTWHSPTVRSQNGTSQMIESDDPTVARIGTWTSQSATQASGGSYLYSSGAEADVLTLQFSGPSIEVLYIAGPLLGTLAINVDDTVLRTVITTADQTAYQQSSRIDYLSDETHTLKVYAQEGGIVAIDAFVIPTSPPDPFSASNEGEASGETRVPFCAPINQMHRVSLTSTGEQANDGSIGVSISEDGRFVAFMSVAALVPSDSDSLPDIYLYDRATCTTELISVSTSGEKANDLSMWGLVSGDGWYVAFESSATNLVTGDTNDQVDIFVRDRQTNTTTRVSVAMGGTEAVGGPSYITDITPDGRYVVFTSYASNLVAGDSNNNPDVFVHDRQAGITSRASLAYDGTEISRAGNGVISADGRYVAFVSSDNSVVADDTNGTGSEIFVRDRQNETTTRVSVTTGGGQTATGRASTPAISSDGRYVAFTSGSSDLVSGDTNGFEDVFVHDRNTNTTIRVSVASDGTQAIGDNSLYPKMSYDGRYIAFLSRASNLVAGTVSGDAYAYVHDQQTGITSLVSLTEIGSQSFTVASPNPILSGDGRFVTFASDVTTLVGNDSNDVSDIFVTPRFPGASNLTATALDDGRIQLNWTDNASDETEYRLERSPDGLNNWVEIGVAPANTTTYTNVSLICNTPYHYRIRAYRASDMTYSAYSNVANTTTAACPANCEAVQQRIQRLSVGMDGGAPDDGGWIGRRSLSDDGRYAVFSSYADNLVPIETTWSEVFLFDRITCQTTLISIDLPSNMISWSPSISGDGRYILFESGAHDPLPNPTNLFLHDRLTGTTVVVSNSIDDPTISSGFWGMISGNGRYVAFVSEEGLIPSDTNNSIDVYVRDLQSNTLEIASLTSSGTLSSGGSAYPYISYDGRYVTFLSTANLVPEDTTDYDVYLRDRVNNTVTLVSYGDDETVHGARSNMPHINTNFWAIYAPVTPDGRYVAFVSSTAGMTANNTSEPTQGVSHVYVRDVLNGTTTLASVGANGNSFVPSISDDGRYIVFSSDANNFVVGDTNHTTDIYATDVYMYDRLTENISWLSQTFDGGVPNSASETPYITPDGRYVSFNSGASNLLSEGGYPGMVLVERSLLFAPGNLVASATGRDAITLTWSDANADETEFHIEQSLDGTSWTDIATLPSDTTQYMNQNLACGTTYHYRVQIYRASDATYSPYSAVATATTAACLPDALAIINPATRSANLVHTLTNPPAGGDYTQFATGFPYGTGGQYLTGDWNGDGVETLGVYRNGAFFFTNDVGTGSTWGGVWFGLGGQPVAGRFDVNANHDCLGVTDSGTWQNGDLFFALYFTCNLDSGATPPLTFQWLSILLPNSQGFTGTYQFVAGDFDGDGLDSIAVRRGNFIAWTNVPPTTVYSAFQYAQYIGAPGTGDEGKLVVGDWDLDAIDSFGLVYQNGTFYRRNDLDWNSNAYTLQQFTPLVGTPFDVASWRPN